MTNTKKGAAAFAAAPFFIFLSVTLCYYFVMLKQQFRLKKKSAFEATYRVKHSYCVGGIVLWVGKKKTDNSFSTKAGFVVSKKTHKRAVKRNRLKRLMRESYRLLLKEGNVGNSQKHISLIFVGFEKSLGNDFSQVKTNIQKLLNSIKS